MSKLTQGTQVYVIDPRPSDPVVLTITCATGFNPGGSPKSQIDDTCLEETEAMAYKPGLMAPGQATLNVNADPTNDSHMALHEIFRDDSITELKWAIGWSDGDAAPTIDSNEDFDLPTARTWLVFGGYIADFPFDFQQNAVVNTAISIQRSGSLQWVKKV